MNLTKIFIASIFCISLFACKEQEQQTVVAPQVYELQTIKKENVSLDRRYTASIRGKQDIKIIPRVTGHLTAIKIKEGSKVKKGELLFVIDQAPYRSALQSAEAVVAVAKTGVESAKLTLESKYKLYASKIISKYDLEITQNNFDSAKAQLLQAEASLKAAKNNLSYTEVKSPSSGVVGTLPYRIGDLVGPTTADGLTVVADNSQMYIYFSMSEGDVLDLVNEYPSIDSAIVAMPEIELELNNRTVYPLKGSVESISGVVDSSTGSVSLRAVFDNSNGKLLSGGAGNIIMPYAKDDIVIISQEATYEIQDQTYVYKVIDGKAVASIVSVDKISNGKEFIVLSGLEEGDVIIAKGAGLVREGTPVQSK